MTVLYLDTSALFKRYVVEPESDAVRAKLEEAAVVATAVITRTEVATALSQAQQEGRIEATEARRAEREFLEDWRHFGRVPVTEELASEAAELAWRQALRAYDAVQLAAAMRCQQIFAPLGGETVLACFDKKLRRAAEAEGLGTWSAE